MFQKWVWNVSLFVPQMSLQWRDGRRWCSVSWSSLPDYCFSTVGYLRWRHRLLRIELRYRLTSTPTTNPFQKEVLTDSIQVPAKKHKTSQTFPRHLHVAGIPCTVYSIIGYYFYVDIILLWAFLSQILSPLRLHIVLPPPFLLHTYQPRGQWVIREDSGISISFYGYSVIVRPFIVRRLIAINPNKLYS